MVATNLTRAQVNTLVRYLDLGPFAPSIALGWTHHGRWPRICAFFSWSSSLTTFCNQVKAVQLADFRFRIALCLSLWPSAVFIASLEFQHLIPKPKPKPMRPVIFRWQTVVNNELSLLLLLLLLMMMMLGSCRVAGMSTCHLCLWPSLDLYTRARSHEALECRRRPESPVYNRRQQRMRTDRR